MRSGIPRHPKRKLFHCTTAALKNHDSNAFENTNLSASKNSSLTGGEIASAESLALSGSEAWEGLMSGCAPQVSYDM